ncbi:hypothetical protein AWC38_SpisGene16295 [Stylophora pistillata]|uniref:Uncharacterized protein n=1 Tax=Stylophora pistillata TaxID=50429 RepID=A0A2B4RSH7_STYPI|nr:hypothetical protein AWC38_SpisGene16295 [Stylophora pistillata]
MDDKAYLRLETSEGAKGARKQTILQPSDETRARSLPVHDFPEASVYVTPSACRFIRKEAEVVEEEVTLVTKTDDSIVVVEPKAYVPTHASTWASNSMRLREYEQLRLHFLQYQLTSARERWEENQDIVGSEKEIGDNIVYVANSLLDCISKAETDMKHVTGEQLQRVLIPVLEQCDEVLRRIPCVRLPPVYPRLLELTDAGPGVGVSSAESRIRILERARVYGN